MATTSSDAEAPGSPGSPTTRTAGELPTWLRRTIIAAIVVAATGVLLWGTSVIQTDGGGEPLDGTIVSLTPHDDAQVLRQTSVGAELQPGYDGRLTIDGIDIPEDQMDGAIDPNSVTAEDLAKYGIRPNNRNRVYFTPGPGKVIEEFTTGRVTVVMRYFEDKLEASTSRTVSWSFRVD
ncbi:MAG: hypothetical protein R2701_04955 [Acidimicrobiales bacterium]